MGQIGMWVGVALGLAVMALFARPAYEALRVSRWLKVPAEVSRVYVESSNLKKSVVYYGCRDYAYAYGGQAYTGRVNCETGLTSRSDAQQAIASFAVGQSIDVWIYIRRPAHSKVVPGVDAHALTGFCVGAFFVALFLYFTMH